MASQWLKKMGGAVDKALRLGRDTSTLVDKTGTLRAPYDTPGQSWKRRCEAAATHTPWTSRSAVEMPMNPAWTTLDKALQHGRAMPMPTVRPSSLKEMRMCDLQPWTMHSTRTLHTLDKAHQDGRAYLKKTDETASGRATRLLTAGGLAVPLRTRRIKNGAHGRRGRAKRRHVARCGTARRERRISWTSPITSKLVLPSV
ncbi:hypothetical protein FA95DRAFT_1612330 [Auriscalpium vulgare]|uniref:Uncharacterized protein n=1 Tax=Auriscalpium vulgare TaxID=40419 RepID=A0ACB8R835_9AGAM|nr:hypothetical protein FA95DRAFT_1612330 [Auriscalpium vulgare]